MTCFSTVKLNKVHQQQATSIINGVPQGIQDVSFYQANCLGCGRVLAQFNQGDSLIDIARYCQDKLAKEFIYCPACGCKLVYSTDVITLDMTQLQEVAAN